MFFKACLLDREVESRRWREWAQTLGRAATVRVVGKETDLRFSVQGRTWIVGDGKFNMPDGEIYTAPITSTIDGPDLLRGSRRAGWAPDARHPPALGDGLPG